MKFITLTFILGLLLIGMFFGISYIDYNYEKLRCCNGYRNFVLDGQIGGECHTWSFLEHLQGIKGCAVEDLRRLG